MPSTVYTGGTSAGNGGSSPSTALRQFGSLLGPIRGRVRVTFEASTANPFALSNVSFGYSTGTIATSADLAAVPLELKFGGASGFSLSAGQTITSDWLNFTTINLAAGAHWAISSDVSAASPNAGTLRNPVSDEIVYIGAVPQYNLQSGSGFSGGSVNLNISIVSIEAAFGLIYADNRLRVIKRRRF